MLSPTGLCRAFAAGADGYVRAEGGVVLVLKTLKQAVEDGDRIHAVICGTGVNSDGRTSGISLPAERYQIELLRNIYDRAGVAPDSVAYIEAHGTGTRVGDPVEAAALGKVLGRARASPLPIGSVKTNIGHTEPASGLAGLLKAMLALEHDEAPPSLHFEEPNPNIDFTDLNLAVTGKTTPLPRSGERRFAGVSSFGFGGTSAHVVIADPPSARLGADAAPRFLMLSAQTDAALRALAGQYARRFDAVGEREGRRIVAATDHRREPMRERLVMSVCDSLDIAPILSRFSQSGQADAEVFRGTAIEGDGSVVFVFSGNGAQWSGMGRAAYRCNSVFRDALAEIDSHFEPLSGWSLTEELASSNLESDLAHTNIAQPMMFAIQAASVRALAAIGIRPSMTMGHSVGEVAAAEAAGILSLSDAVRLILQSQPAPGIHRELRRDGGDIRRPRRREDPRRANSGPLDRSAQFSALPRRCGASRGVGPVGEARPDAQAATAPAEPRLSIPHKADGAGTKSSARKPGRLEAFGRSRAVSVDHRRWPASRRRRRRDLLVAQCARHGLVPGGRRKGGAAGQEAIPGGRAPREFEDPSSRCDGPPRRLRLCRLRARRGLRRSRW